MSTKATTGSKLQALKEEAFAAEALWLAGKLQHSKFMVVWRRWQKERDRQAKGAGK